MSSRIRYRFVWLALGCLLASFTPAQQASAKSRTADADSLVRVGQAYYAEYRFMDALDVLANAVAVADETQDATAYTQALLAIGNIHTLFNDYEQALHYYEICLQHAREKEVPDMVNRALSNMLLCYAEMGMPDEAQRCYQSIGTLDQQDEKICRLYSFINQAQLAKARQDLHAAIYLHHQAMEYAKMHEMNGHYVAAEMGKIGTLEEALGHEEAALDWYQQCRHYSEQGGYMTPLVSAYERLASLYLKQGNDSVSSLYQRLYTQLADSLFLERDYNNKRSLIAAYETRRNHLQISLLSHRNQTLIWVIAGIVTLLLIMAALVIYILRQNRTLESAQRLLIEKHHDLTQQLEVQSRLRDEYLTTMQGQTTTSEDDSPATATDASAPLLSAQQTDVLLMSMAKVMEDTNVICDPDFCLQMLAQRVQSNTKYVSWTINATYGKNFKTYLNEYRIREATRQLSDREHYGHLTIAAIAEQVGFKSTTSFNQVFKRIMGMTPAAYQRLSDTHPKSLSLETDEGTEE